MSKIKIYALGGLGENGKNMFCVEVDERIFVFDAGLKYPEKDMYGIDAVIPNIDYLIQNKERIEGIFISHGHDDHIGALPYLLKNINLRVYATHFTMCLIESLLQENNMNIKRYKLYRINDTKVLKFGDVSISFFNTTHSIPESVGIVVSTKDGNIVFAPDFNFGIEKNAKYLTSFEKITNNKNVLAVLAESIGISDIDRSTNDLLFEHTFKNILDSNEHRIFVSVFSTDLSRIQKMVDMCVEKNRKVAFMGRKAEEVVGIAINSGYLKIPDEIYYLLKPYDENNKNEVDNLVVFVTGTLSEPYNSLSRICANKDRFIRFTPKDKVVFISDPTTVTLRNYIKTMDDLYRKDVEVDTISKKKLRTSHATAEDLYLLYSMLKPKYIYPIIGEYRHLYRHKDLLKTFGYGDEQIVLLDNGEVSVLEGGELVSKEIIPTGDEYVDGTLIGNVSSELVSERERLSEEGVVIIVAYLDMRRRIVVENPVINSKGFVYTTDLETFNQTISEFFLRMMKNSLNKPKFDKEQVILSLSEEIGKIVYRISKKRPAILPVLIEIKK
ncbi:MAG: ribonuclease J [Bacilli bacterium]|nr:ribonuclease J [Bacilli bacterium]